LNSDKEGRSEPKEEIKYEARRQNESFTATEENKYYKSKGGRSYKKVKYRKHRELESSEDYYSDDIDTAYYQNIQEKVKR
jgi:hypothetical protein